MTIYWTDEEWSQIVVNAKEDGFCKQVDYIKSHALKQRQAIFKELQEIKVILKNK